MSEMAIAYLIWLACALLFVVLGVIDIANASKGKVFGFYNISPPPKAESLTDVVAYNRAVGKLFIASGLIFAEQVLQLFIKISADIHAVVGFQLVNNFRNGTPAMQGEIGFCLYLM